MRPFLIALLFLSLNSVAQNIRSFDLLAGSKSSYPFGFFAGKDKLYFATYQPEWHSAGQCVLRSIDKNDNLEMYTGFNTMQSSPPQVASIAELNNEIYFASYLGGFSDRLCRSTPSNAFEVIDDIKSGNVGVNPRIITPHNNKIYFVAWDNFRDELFEYNPTLDTVIQVTQLSSPQVSVDIRELIPFDNKIFFVIKDTTIGSGQRFLYNYDPTTKTTNKIDNQNPAFYSPSMLTVYNNKLYFAAHNQNVLNATHRMYLHEYDGSNAPQRLPGSDITAQYKGGDYEVFLPYKGGLIYETDSALDLYWKYDFAGQKTIRVSKAVLGPQFDSIFTRTLTIYNDKIYFLAIDKNNTNMLMSYDDTTMQFIQGLTDPWTPTKFHTSLYLQGMLNSNEGVELCKLDGAPASITGTKNSIQHVTLFPNPTRDAAQLTFSLTKNQSLNVTLTDMNGRIVYQTGNVLYSAAEHNINIPLNNLPAGSYMYSVLDNKGVMMSSGKLQKL